MYIYEVLTPVRLSEKINYDSCVFAIVKAKTKPSLKSKKAEALTNVIMRMSFSHKAFCLKMLMVNSEQRY